MAELQSASPSAGRLNVLHVVPTWWPAVRYGGPIVSVRALCKALQAVDCDVAVCVTNVDGATDTDVPIDRVWRDQQLEMHSFPSTLARRFYYSPPMGRYLDASIGQFDVLHTHSVFLWPTWKAARAARRAAVPYVLSPRGMLVPELIRARSAIPKRLWIGLIERSNLRQAAMIHVTSETERQDLLRMQLGPLPPIVTIPNGVALPEEKSLPRIERQIAFVGRLSWKKGLDRLLEAVAPLHDTTLLVAGPDNEGLSSQFVEQALALGMQSRVRFLGAIDEAARDRLLAESAVLVVPSLSENFGNVVVEAMAVGCPVITTPGVGAADLLRHAQAGLVCEGAPEALRAAIVQMLSGSAAAAEMGVRGRRYCIASLSWESAAQAMRTAYVEAIERHRRSRC